MFSYFSYMYYLACDSFDYTKLMLSVFLFHIFAAQNDNNDGSKYTRRMYRDMVSHISKRYDFFFQIPIIQLFLVIFVRMYFTTTVA